VDDILGSVHRDRVSAETIGVTLFAFGRYVDEVFVRHFGGRWCREEDTEMRGLVGLLIVVARPNKKVCNPIGKVFKRIQGGEAESPPCFL
jgi:hypothetical protein